MLWLCFKLPICLFGHTRGTSVIKEKAKAIHFMYMQPRKMKFKFVQINMKHLLYSQAGLSLCWSEIPHYWKSHVAAHLV